MAESGWKGDWKGFKTCTSTNICAQVCGPAENIVLGPLESASTILWRYQIALLLHLLMWSPWSQAWVLCRIPTAMSILLPGSLDQTRLTHAALKLLQAYPALGARCQALHAVM